MRGLFVTGTDTEVGKTWVSLALLHAFRAQGRSTAAMKPVASGACRGGGRLVNEDAIALQKAASVPAPYHRVNPYVFEPPMAPHLAAEAAGVAIALETIVNGARGLAAGADLLLVEGVGGWRVPLGPDGDVQELARLLGLPVLLVVGVRLGCINHALLTAEAIAGAGCPLAGWVANRIDPDALEADRVVEAMAARLPSPLLADLPYHPSGSARDAAAHLGPRALALLTQAIDKT